MEAVVIRLSNKLVTRVKTLKVDEKKVPLFFGLGCLHFFG